MGPPTLQVCENSKYIKIYPDMSLDGFIRHINPMNPAVPWSSQESARPAEVPEAGSPPLRPMAMPENPHGFAGISWKKAIDLGDKSREIPGISRYFQVFPKSESVHWPKGSETLLPSWLRPEGQGTSLRWTTCEGKEMHILRIHQRPVEPFTMQ